jgi:hypothetical protein
MRVVSLIVGTGLTIGIGMERIRAYHIALAETQAEGLASPTDSPALEAAGRVEQETERFDISKGIPRTPPQPKALSDKESRPLGEVDPDGFQSIDSKAAACRRFEGKLIAFYDQTALIQKCKMRLIEDPLLLNQMRNQNEVQIQDVPASVYKLFAVGDPIRESDIKGIESALGFSRKGSDCARLNGQYVTANGVAFYYIEKCKKRRFKFYAGLEEHNRAKRTILSITPSQLERFPDGPDMANEGGDVSDIWVEIDGDAGWQRASRFDAEKPKAPDSPESLREVARQQRAPVKPAALCSEIGGMVVSFYHKLYFVDKCTLRPIDEKDALRLYVRLDGRDQVRDLAANEKRAMRDGKPISVDEVIKRLDR